MLVLCLLEYLKLNSRRERGESHFFMLKTYIVINQYNEVLDIETNLGLLKGLPKEVLSKLNISGAYLSGETEKEIEVVIISGDNVDNISQTVDN